MLTLWLENLYADDMILRLASVVYKIKMLK